MNFVSQRYCGIPLTLMGVKAKLQKNRAVNVGGATCGSGAGRGEDREIGVVWFGDVERRKRNARPALECIPCVELT